MSRRLAKTHCKQGHDLATRGRLDPKSGSIICRDCSNNNHKNCDRRNPARRAAIARKCHLKRTYGLTIEVFDLLFASQHNCCALCKTDIPGRNGWHVDHDHTTGLIRGLLCHACNIGLGHFKDDTTLLKRAITYLTGKPPLIANAAGVQ